MNWESPVAALGRGIVESPGSDDMDRGAGIWNW